MTIPKMEAVLPLMEIMPSACESEMHVCFQQKEIFDYLTEHKIQRSDSCRLVPHRDRREISVRKM